MSVKRYFHRSTTATPLQKITQTWENFLNFHTQLCGNNKSNSSKPAAAYTEIKALNHIIEILVEEDSLDTQVKTLRPCLELLITSKMFEILTAAAQIDIPNGLFLIVIKIFTKILKKVQNQDLVSQMSFHCSLNSMLRILLSMISSSIGENNIICIADDFKNAVIKLITRLLERIKGSSGHLDLFVSNYEKKSEFIPLSILMYFFNDLGFYKYDKSPFLLIGKIFDENVLRVIIRDHELANRLVMKLGFYFQMRELQTVKVYAEFLEQFYSNCISKTLKEEIIDSFYENFCAPILTPRLQSNEHSTRINSSIFLSTVIQEFKSIDLLLPIVYFLQGKAKDGSKRLKHIVNTPTSSQKKPFDFTPDPNKGCLPTSDICKMWSILIDNLNSKYDQLSIYTLRIIYYLLSQGGKKVVKLLITDSFSGNPPTSEVCIKANTFLSIIPNKITPKDLNRNLNDYLHSAYLRCSSAVKYSTIVLEEFSEYTGASSYKAQIGETGGTDVVNQDFYVENSEKFFEGEILHVVLMKFRNFLENSVDENLYVTGIISTLATFPKEKGLFGSLHNFLLGPLNLNKDGFLACFKQLAMEIEFLASKDENFNEKLASTIQEMGVPIRSSASDTFYDIMLKGRNKNKKSKSTQIEDRSHIEAVMIFQECIKEIVSILIFKKVLDDMLFAVKNDENDILYAN
ncbi:hypothetical protein SteCoe_19544 [Stentor coeruleus]|uniref:FHF complex subunit HOOK-interacting protein C-terminal domain-containing protein n=1 Tax=Stentor coeruleus TaxID=5963 RepID=A0A1R2BTZ4_9CILI|nr:hypothetical protein SteCoe_19544 [Stentor coeruleus]